MCFCPTVTVELIWIDSTLNSQWSGKGKPNPHHSFNNNVSLQLQTKWPMLNSSQLPVSSQSAPLEWRHPLNQMFCGALWNWLLSQTNHLRGLTKCSVWLKLLSRWCSTQLQLFCFFCWGLYKTKLTGTKDQKHEGFQSNNRGVISVSPRFVELPWPSLDHCVLAKPDRSFVLLLVSPDCPITRQCTLQGLIWEVFPSSADPITSFYGHILAFVQL